MEDKEKRKYQIKSISGITLMVLIITVVIMLILASVSVSLFTSGDGIFNNSDTAVIEYKRKSLIEVVKAADIYLEQNNRFDRTKKKDIVELVDKIKEISEVNDKDYIIDVRPEEQSATIIDKKTGVAVDIIIDEKDRVIIETSVIEDIKDITVPKVEHTINPQEPEKATVVTITIKATEENKGIAKIKFPDGTETEYPNEKTVTAKPYRVTKNDSYRFIVVGANGRQAIETVKITNIKGVTDINMEILNSEPTNDKTRIKITYDENPAFEGKELTNADRYQFSKGENNWEIATTNPMIVETETNGIIYARYYDGKDGYKIKPVTVNNIDKLEPNDFDLQVTATKNSITVSAVGEVTDNWPTDGIFAPSNGGIRGYQFQLLNADGTKVLKDWTPAYPYQENSSYTFSQVQDGVEIKAETIYKVNMRAIDKADNKTEASNRDSEEASIATKGIGIKPSTVVKIGDYVNYSIEVDGVTYSNWRVLNIDQPDGIEIVCLEGPNTYLGSKDDLEKCKYDLNYGVKILNDLSGKFVDHEYTVSARSLGTYPTHPTSNNFEDWSVQYSNRGLVQFSISGFDDLEALKTIGMSSTYSVWIAKRSVNLFDHPTISGQKGGTEYGLCYYKNGSITNPMPIMPLIRRSAAASWTNLDKNYTQSCRLAPVVKLSSETRFDETRGNGTQLDPWVLIK